MRHHYIPKFLLRGWKFVNGVGQTRLPAYYWDGRTNELKMFPAGFDQIGAANGLFAFRADHPDGRDAIETNFFKRVDNSAARIRTKMIVGPNQGLSAQEKLEFSQFLLSLDARRPRNLEQLIRIAADYYRTGLNQDPKIMELLAELGEHTEPAGVWERLTGHPMEDQALLLVQSLTMNTSMAVTLVGWPWIVRRDLEHLVLSDRPLVRHRSKNDPNTLWALPLSPSVAWFGSPNPALLNRLERTSAERVRNMLNLDSAHQCDRYVLSLDLPTNLGWLARRLKDPHRTSGREVVGGLRAN